MSQIPEPGKMRHAEFVFLDPASRSEIGKASI